MIKALWFLIQIIAISAACVWVLQQPGSVVISALGYTVTAKLGVVLFGVGVLLLLTLIVYRIAMALGALPGWLGRHNAETRRQKGMRAMTRGFAALAAGDAKNAAAFAGQTRKFLPQEKGLPLLLEAQAARLRGDQAGARRIFQDMLKDKDAAFFGIRGLMSGAIEEGDYRRALDHARQALSQNPRQPWIIKTVYELELQNREWDAALTTGRKAIKYKAIDTQKVRSDETAILLYRSRQKEIEGQGEEALKLALQAYRIDKCYVPSVFALLTLYVERGQKGKIKPILEKAWKASPHPDLLPFWEVIEPEAKKNDPMRRLKWYERIVALRPDSVEAQIAAAQAAMEQKLWGEAKAYLTAAERIEPLSRLYRLRADIIRQTSRDEEEIHRCMELAADAPAAKVWYCARTGHIYERWSPIAEPHGAFNTIVWGYPRFHAGENIVREQELLLEPAA